MRWVVMVGSIGLVGWLWGWWGVRGWVWVGPVLLALLTSKSDRAREPFLPQSHPHTTSRKIYETFSCEPFSFGASLPGAQRTSPTNLSLLILLSDAAHSPRAELVALDGEGHKCRRRGRCRRRWWNHAGSVQSGHPPPSHVAQFGCPASVRCGGRFRRRWGPPMP